MTKTNHALYQVALKLLVKRNDLYLTLYTNDGFVDFPGGRIDASEYELPFNESLQREIKEELGDDVVLDVGSIAFICKRAYTFNGQNNRILAVYYVSIIVGGEIKLSDEHAKYHWLTVDELLTLKPEQFVSLDEYEQMTTYFRKLSA